MIKKTQRAFKILCLISLFIVVFLGAWASWYEPSSLSVNQYELKIPNWNSQLNNYKIVALADIHGGSAYITEAKLRRIVELVNAENPDLIVLLGDYVSQKLLDHKSLRMPMKTIADNLSGLHSRDGVFAVIGNHEQYDEVNVKRELERVGIRVLINEIVPLEANNQRLWILGIEDYWKRRRVKIDEPLQKVAAGEPVLAITHNPDIFVQLENTPISLLMAGHTHGGQCNFPIIGAPIVPSDFGQRFLSGHIIENDRHLFVSRGIGTTGPPVRFGAPPEISILTISSN